ncbi:MAG: hypothetical protein LBH00_01045 [Planctomycetaceae bacterium]|jgi:hypothetical protein|nr:hypothetical protein [Planctomycetaceae bacterium]
MSSSETSAAARLLQYLRRVPDPRSKHGVSHTFHTVIAIVIPGLPAGISPIAEILKRISIKDLQNDFRNLFFAIGRWRIACIWRRKSTAKTNMFFRVRRWGMFGRF